VRLLPKFGSGRGIIGYARRGTKANHQSLLLNDGGTISNPAAGATCRATTRTRRVRHTDTSFLTPLAPNEVPGLSIRTQSGNWIDAPAIHDAYVVNGGQLLQRWTNDYFFATPHRAVNRSGGERYALAFFCDSNIDWPVTAVPTCVEPDKPPKYPTTYYTDYMIRYQQRSYNVFGTEGCRRMTLRRTLGGRNNINAPSSAWARRIVSFTANSAMRIHHVDRPIRTSLVRRLVGRAGRLHSGL
jgi:hypothetical protein